MFDTTSLLTGAGGPIVLLIIMAIVFAESGLLVGFFLPGDSLLFTAGVLTATGVLPVPILLVAVGVVVAAFAGDQVGYAIGRATGHRILTKPKSRLFAPERAEQAHRFFLRHGSKAVVLARFVPVMRTFVPTVAGVGAMPYRRFVAFNAVGAVAWSATMLTAGYFLGGIPFVAAHVEVMTLAVITLSLLPAAISLLRSRLRGSGGAEEHDDAPTDDLVEAST